MSLGNETGLPTGIHFTGRPDDEPTALRTAYAYQQRAKWYARRPG